MTYRVVETITNLTDTTYDNAEEFVAQCYYHGYKESDIIVYWGKELIKAGLSEDYKDTFILAASITSTTWDEWDSTTQTCVKTQLFQNEDDYNMIKDVLNLTHKNPSTRYSKALVSKGTV